jgi:hypothetical protein
VFCGFFSSWPFLRGPVAFLSVFSPPELLHLWGLVVF